MDLENGAEHCEHALDFIDTAAKVAGEVAKVDDRLALPALELPGDDACEVVEETLREAYVSTSECAVDGFPGRPAMRIGIHAVELHDALCSEMQRSPKVQLPQPRVL